MAINFDDAASPSRPMGQHYRRLDVPTAGDEWGGETARATQIAIATNRCLEEVNINTIISRPFICLAVS